MEEIKQALRECDPVWRNDGSTSIQTFRALGAFAERQGKPKSLVAEGFRGPRFLRVTLLSAGSSGALELTMGGILAGRRRRA